MGGLVRFGRSTANADREAVGIIKIAQMFSLSRMNFAESRAQDLGKRS
jgi:hypothetical protein